ncbi:hypothetical protein [Chitinophaga sp. CF418]|uniref:hypothetical protein n=1 Tax=Chitinophaga sp. CF418 TaxID=1855287 RepID=UPI0009173495|nr:hypothetical protein [Chitinophaga sp. CF418]SHN18235.1 hypothetical protein SAMN05216311_106200 [Chitinophaga sp. CF418]
MKKLLVPALLTLAACKKEDATVRQPDYDGKWYIHQTVDKVYTLENGDTAYTRYDVNDYPGTANYIDFRINLGKGDALMYLDSQLDSMSYEAVSRVYFRLDTTLCEVTHITDSTFQFNTIIFDNTTIPDRVQVTQHFFVLSR